MGNISMKTKATRIFIVDDHPMVRDGLALLIGSEPDLQVCGSAGTMRESLQQIAKKAPDVMIVDLSLKDGLGLDLIKAVKERHPEVRVLVVSAFEEDQYAERALRGGALGYVNKQECETTLLEAIRTVQTGRRHVSKDILNRLLNQALGGTDGSDPLSQLSDREFEVYRLIGQGVTTGEIAKRLHVSPHTVDSHRERIRYKLGIETGHELLKHAMRWVIDHEP
jgi:DNA-binding NarL/FixJ family response regulator